MTATTLSLAFLLWPLISLLGGQGFAPLAGLAALALLPLAVTRMRPHYYMIPLALFFIYVGVTVLWSPESTPLVSFDQATGEFDMRKELRAALAFPAIAVLLAATQRIDGRQRLMVLKVARWALIVQLVVVVVLTLFEKQLLQLLTPLVPDTGEGVQNISRNSLIMATAAPFLIHSVTEDRSPRLALLIATALVVLESAILLHRGVNGGIFALAVAFMFVLTVAVFRRSGFKILASGIAVLVWTAPMLFGFLSLGADATKATTSSEWRLAIWRRVVEVTAERPIEGSGLGVLRTMRERIPSGEFTNQFYVPNHAHNMLLQLWAESGAIGAALLSITILLVGWRLPEPQKLGLAAPRIAGLAGVTIAITSVSFDLWNEWWWASAGFLAVLAAVVARESYAASVAAIPRLKHVPEPQVEIPVLR